MLDISDNAVVKEFNTKPASLSLVLGKHMMDDDS